MCKPLLTADVPAATAQNRLTCHGCPERARCRAPSLLAGVGVAGSNPIAPTKSLRNPPKHNEYGHLTRRLFADARCHHSPQVAIFCIGLGPKLGPPESQLSDANAGGCWKAAVRSGHTRWPTARDGQFPRSVVLACRAAAAQQRRREVFHGPRSRSIDESRDRDDRGWELSQGSRGGLSNRREREPLDARDVFTRDLELPRGPESSPTTSGASWRGPLGRPHDAA